MRQPAFPPCTTGEFITLIVHLQRDYTATRSSESDDKAAYTHTLSLSRDQPIPKLWPPQIDAETERLISDRAETCGLQTDIRRNL